MFNRSVFLLSLTLAAPAAAAPMTFARGMERILDDYLAVQEILVTRGDQVSTAAVEMGSLRAAAQRMLATARALAPLAERPEHKWLAETIDRTTGALARARSSAAARRATQGLSRAMATWATQSKPLGVNVVYSARARGVWLQRGPTIRNPYLPRQLSGSGRVISGPARGTTGGLMSECPHDGTARWLKEIGQHRIRLPLSEAQVEAQPASGTGTAAASKPRGDRSTGAAATRRARHRGPSRHDGR